MKKKIIFVIILFSFFMSGNVLAAQTPTEYEVWLKQLEDREAVERSQKIKVLLNQLKNSQEWHERSDAVANFYSIDPSFWTDEMRTALIDEFKREYQRSKNNKMEYCRTEACERAEGGEDGYYRTLRDIVSDMADERVYPLFVKLGSSTALIKYGDKGVEEILKNMEQDKTVCVISAESGTLEDALKPKKKGYTPTGAIKAKIKRGLIKALKKDKHRPKDRSAGSCATKRILTLRALGHLAAEGDKEVISVIEHYAKEDKYKRKRKVAKDKWIEEFKVRKEAKKILEKIKEGKKDKKP